MSRDSLIRFEQLIINYTLLISPEKISQRRASNHGYLVLRTMLMHNRVYPTIFYALDYRNVCTFHRQSRYSAKNLLFSAVEAVVHTWQNPVRRLGFNSYGTQCPSSGSFLTLLNVLKQLTHQLVMFFWDRSSSSISSNFLSSKFFGAPQRFLSTSSKSLIL